MIDAFFIRKYGGPGVLERGSLPQQPVGARDVRIRIHAASVNPIDVRIREGEVKVVLPFRFPLVLGNDCSGVVVEVGSSVSRFRVGDAVYTRLPKRRIGSFATEVVADEAALAHKPSNHTHAEAASLPLVLLTAQQVLTEVAGLERGQSVLIHAGAGGVGSVAIQLARHMGLNVVTTVSAKNIEFVKELGADQAIDRQAHRFDLEVRGMDAVLDSVGMSNLLASFACVRPGGTVVSISDGPDVDMARSSNVNRLLWPVFWVMSARPRAAAKRASAHYRYWFMRPDGAQLEGLSPLLESRAVRPVVGSVLPFEQTPEAIALVEAGKGRGKVVIQMRGD